MSVFSARVNSILRVITATSNAVEPAPYNFSAEIVTINCIIIGFAAFLCQFKTSKPIYDHPPMLKRPNFYKQDSAVYTSQTGTNDTCAGERNTTIIEYKVPVGTGSSNKSLKVHNTKSYNFDDTLGAGKNVLS